MFGRKSKNEVPTSTTETVEAPIAPEQLTTRTQAVLGSVATHESRAGFQQRESGLLVPENGTKTYMDNEAIVTDRRSITLEQVEANHKSEQERLNSPLDKAEINRALDVIEHQMRQRAEQYDGDDVVYRRDIERDPAALYRVRKVVNGENDIYVDSVVRHGETLSASEKLGLVVARYAKLVPENFDENSQIGSMGGTVEIAPDGVIHCSGYNGSILYDFARAKQILQKLETMPKDVRTKVTEANGTEQDASWLYDEPVTVDPALTKIEVAA